MVHDVKIKLYKLHTCVTKTGREEKHYKPIPGTKTVRLKDNLHIKTEKDLLLQIYRTYGAGQYYIAGFGKGRKGVWAFWKGDINDDGFLFFPKEYNRKEVEEWKELAEGDDDPTMQGMIDEAKQDAKNEVSNKRYGFVPFLKRSGKRGEYHYWDDEELEKKMQANESENEQNDWGIEKPKKKEEDDWGVSNKEEPKDEDYGWEGKI